MYFNEQIRLAGDMWRDIIKKHPEVKGLKPEITLTVSHPEVIVKVL